MVARLVGTSCVKENNLLWDEVLHLSKCLNCFYLLSSKQDVYSMIVFQRITLVIYLPMTYDVP